jgi:Regulator of chromosome condensation (RCC1) repeat
MTAPAAQSARDHRRPHPTSRWGAVPVALAVIMGALVFAACGSAPRPATLPAGTKVTAIAASCLQSLAVTAAGQVLAWGDNAYGELGDGDTTESDVPVKVRLPKGD